MKRKLQTAIAALACMVFGHNVSAQTTFTYDFDSGTPLAGVVSTAPGSVEAVSGGSLLPALIGNATNVIRPKNWQASNTAVADLTSFPIGSDYSVTWKEYVNTNIQLKKGFLLRGSGTSGYKAGTSVLAGLKQGYYFMVQNNANATVGAVGTVTFRIFDVSTLATLTQLNPSTTAKTIVGLAQNTACWFRASVTGPTLKFEYSIDGVNWNVGDIVTNTTYNSGSTQLFYGVGIGSNLYEFDDVKFTSNDPTWDGATWLNGTPTSVSRAIFMGNYTETGALAARNLDVKGTAIVSVPAGKSFTVAETVTVDPTAILTIENNANLIQGSAATTNTNVGNVVVKRNSNSLYRMDYSMWSSPVSETQTLADFSPMTSQSPSRFYIYDGINNQFDNTLITPGSVFASGTGYLIRMPNTDPLTDYDTGLATLSYPGVFTGKPNNGNVSLTTLTAGQYYSVGNPYPSTLSANAFINGNSTDGTLYFWRKKNAGIGSAYASYNLVGATVTASASGNGSEVPNGTIQVGQGFIVKTAANVLNFTNAMREVSPTSTQFFKTKNMVRNDRIWLNLTNTTGVFSQALLGYLDGATLGVDNGIDGAYINDSPVALTSSIDGREYTIQGRPAFDSSDVVALNFKTNTAGNYTIAIDHSDGVFAAGQDVYLVDNTTGTETNLKTDGYTFKAPAGTSNTRFSLKYQKTLKVDAPAFNENSVSVYKNKGTLYVNSGAMAISNIKVYDIQGRLIAEQKNVKANTAAINNLKATNQVLVVQVTSEDNKVVNKKVVN